MLDNDPDPVSGPVDDHRSRRQYLAGLAAIGTVGLAGCSGGGESNGGGTHTEASGDRCPSLPLSSTEQRIDGSPGFVFEGPADATYQTQGQGTDGVSGTNISYPRANGGDSWLVQVSGIPQERSTVDEAVAQDSYGQSVEEVTSDYDTAVGGIRVFYLEQLSTYEVYLPTEPVVLQVGVNPLTAPDRVTCPDAATATVDGVVETLRPIQ